MTRTNNHWTVEVERSDMYKDVLFVTMTDNSARHEPLYASARFKWRRGSWKVQLSELQTEDGVPVDNRSLYRLAQREVVKFLSNRTQT